MTIIINVKIFIMFVIFKLMLKTLFLQDVFVFSNDTQNDCYYASNDREFLNPNKYST